jgi:hypothetical protein
MCPVADGPAGGESREGTIPRERPNRLEKRRTREYIVADLSVHHVEGPILRCGFTVDRVVHSYCFEGAF